MADDLPQSLVALDNKTSTVSGNPSLYAPAERMAAVTIFARKEGITGQPTYFAPNEVPTVVLKMTRLFAAVGVAAGSMDFNFASQSGLIPVMYMGV